MGVNDSFRQGKPLNIVGVKGNQLHIDIDPLCKILKELKNLPVTIVSVNGRSQSGKSFLLAQAMKFLLFKIDHDKNWIDQNLDREHSFPCRRSIEGVTEGIQVWSQPYILENKGKQLAIILIDNQGLHHLSTEMAYKLSSLSLLLSSLFIYNDEVHTLENMQDFYEHMKLAQHVNADSNIGMNFKFGDLAILFRDWKFKEEYPCQLYDKNSDGKSLYKYAFQTEETGFAFQTDVMDYSECIKMIPNKFHDAYVYCMCHPDETLQDMNFIRDISKNVEFKQNVISFIERMFSYEQLRRSSKKMYGEALVASSYEKFVKNWSEAIKKDEYNILYKSLMDITENTYYQGKIKECGEIYSEGLNEYIKANTEYFYLAQRRLRELIDKKWNGIKEYTINRSKYKEDLNASLYNILKGKQTEILRSQKDYRKIERYVTILVMTVSVLCIIIVPSTSGGIQGAIPAGVFALILVISLVYLLYLVVTDRIAYKKLLELFNGFDLNGCSQSDNHIV